MQYDLKTFLPSTALESDRRMGTRNQQRTNNGDLSEKI